jgi:hypothetical protein
MIEVSYRRSRTLERRITRKAISISAAMLLDRTSFAAARLPPHLGTRRRVAPAHLTKLADKGVSERIAILRGTETPPIGPGVSLSGGVPTPMVRPHRPCATHHQLSCWFHCPDGRITTYEARTERRNEPQSTLFLPIERDQRVLPTGRQLQEPHLNAEQITYAPLEVPKPVAASVWIVDSGPIRAMGVTPFAASHDYYTSAGWSISLALADPVRSRASAFPRESRSDCSHHCAK